MKSLKRIIIIAVIAIAVNISVCFAATGKVNTDGVRVRKQPNTTSEIVTVLNKEAGVEILETSGEWYKIKYNSYVGYIRSDLIDTNGTAPVTTPSPTPVPTTTPEPVTTPEPTSTTTPEPAPVSENDLLGTKKINSETKMYILPVMSSSVVDVIAKDTTVTVKKVINGWAYIAYAEKTGWIRITKISPETVPTTTTPQTPATQQPATFTEKKGYIKVDQAIVRAKASTNSEVVTGLVWNTEIKIIGEENDFYKISLNNKECYIAKRLVADKKQQSSRSSTSRTSATPAPTTTSTQTPATTTTTTTKQPETTGTTATSPVGEQMATLAKSFVGYKYVYGGASPSTGFDCSGLVYYVCKQLGYNVNRGATSQSKNGTYVAKKDLQVGDLVFFSDYKTLKGIGHVGIYIGNNQFVHASTEKTGVKISSLSDGNYAKRYVTARRIGV